MGKEGPKQQAGGLWACRMVGFRAETGTLEGLMSQDPQAPSISCSSAFIHSCMHACIRCLLLLSALTCFEC